MKKLINKVMLFLYIVSSFLSFLLKKRIYTSPKKILIINTLRLGDVVMSTPVFKAIKEKYTELKLSVLVRANVADILNGNPYIDEIIPSHGKNSNILLIKDLRKKGFDTCINLCEGKLNSIIYASGIPVRIGYTQKHKYRDKFFLTDPVQWKGGFKGLTPLFMRLLEPIGIDEADYKPDIFPRQEDIAYIKTILPNDKKPKIVIHPGSRNLTRRWPYYKQLINDINKKYDVLIILTGDDSEYDLIKSLTEGLVKKKIINLCGKTTLNQIIALCSMVDLVIGNDTGVLHIARALRTHNIILFGPEDTKITGEPTQESKQISVDVPCRKENSYFGMRFDNVKRCKKEVCDSLLCLKNIVPENILTYVEKQMEMSKMMQ